MTGVKPEWLEYAREMARNAPPLSERQKDELRRIFTGVKFQHVERDAADAAKPDAAAGDQ
ncbi:hypothetical protein [Cellulomonas sp. SG140]|uniref:hypothetical protein n=1 Tax=Cellulomonas sp. SG140 TaxID=2976536 RepID=UPI0021E8AFCA|nr:hypothetical protein [Cellulomonas sp. SG140]